MKTIEINSVEGLNDYLEANNLAANGKNMPVDHLHTTCAQSPRMYENLCGIYLTKASYAWMALWMAVTKRDAIKKRSIAYIEPKRELGDAIGHIKIYFEQENINDCFCDEAFLYFFDLSKHGRMNLINCSNIAIQDKQSFLENEGFYPGTFERRGAAYETFFLREPGKALVALDEWQIALIHFDAIIPDIELVLSKHVIASLRLRASRSLQPIGDNYIVHSK